MRIVLLTPARRFIANPFGLAYQIQRDQSKWTYRNQVVATPNLPPWTLFAGVKLTEALFHLRPTALARLFVGSDTRVRKMLRSSFMAGIRVVVAEVAEFLFQTRFVTTSHRHTNTSCAT